MSDLDLEEMAKITVDRAFIRADEITTEDNRLAWKWAEEKIATETRRNRREELKAIGFAVVFTSVIMSLAYYFLNPYWEEAFQPKYEIRNEWEPMMEEKRVYKA